MKAFFRALIAALSTPEAKGYELALLRIIFGVIALKLGVDQGQEIVP